MEKDIKKIDLKCKWNGYFSVDSKWVREQTSKKGNFF